MCIYSNWILKLHKKHIYFNLAISHIKLKSSFTIDNCLFTVLLPLRHRRAALKIKKESLHLISVNTFEYSSPVLLAIFLSKIVMKYRAFGTCTPVNCKD